MRVRILPGQPLLARRFAIVNTVLLVTLLAGTARAADGTSVDPVAEADNRFGFKLFSELARSSPGHNILVSPTSIALALGVAYNGARGPTAKEMARCLELQGLELEAVNRSNADLLRSLQSQGSGVELQVATSLWAERGVTFRPAFLQAAESSFQAQVTALELGSVAAVARINDWVRDKTRGKIDGIVDRLSPDDVLVIVNAVYFRGTWDEKFDAKATRDKGFTLLDGSTRPCPMMSRTGVFPYFKGPRFQAIALPYSGKMVSFHVILPDSGASLSAVVAGLTSETWKDWGQKLEPSSGHVALPRFEMSYDVKLNDALAALGMNQAFDASADFGAMANVRPLFISEVRHKSRIEVNEQGTEAAAATSVRMRKSTVVLPRNAPFVMIVDRPFLCAIQDRVTGLVLFLGAVTDPRRV